MTRRIETGVFFAATFVLLLLQFHSRLGPGQYLYLSIIEDPAARLSFFPWQVLAARELRAGHFPLWNPYSGAGMPLLANLQSAVFFPLQWLYYLLPSPRSLDLMVILRLALAATFTFRFGRGLGLGRTGAALSGLGFAFSGYFMKHANMVNVSSEMWLPLLLDLLWRQRAGITRGRFLVSALVWAMVFGGGNPEAALYVSLLALAFSAATTKESPGRRVLVGFFAPWLLGAIAAAVQALPFLEYLGAGWHIHGPQLHLLGEPAAPFIANLVAPWLSGPDVVAAPYVGITVFLLAMIAVMHPAGPRRTALFFLGAATLLLALIFRLPPLSFLAYLPPLNRTAHLKFAMAGVTFCLAMLAGIGLDTLARGQGRGRKISIALAIPTLLLMAGGFYAKQSLHKFQWGGFMTPFLALLIAGALIVLSLRRGRPEGAAGDRTRTMASLAAALAVFELMILYLGFSIKSDFDPAVARFRDPAVPEAMLPISADPSHPRFTGIGDVLQHNLNLLFDLSDLRAFDGIYPRRYVEAMGRIEGFGMDRAVENFFSHGWSFDVRPENLGQPPVNELGVKYIATHDPLDLENLTLVRDDKIKIYENRLAWPRAFLARAGAKMSPDAAVISSTWDRVELTGEGPGELVLGDVFFPGWQAETDGGPSQVRPWQDLFRSVTIGPGPHRVVMTYRPWGFRIGLWVSLTGLTGMMAAGWARKKNRD